MTSATRTVGKTGQVGSTGEAPNTGAARDTGAARGTSAAPNTGAARGTSEAPNTGAARDDGGLEWRDDATRDLLDAIVALPDRLAAERFFRDLCTLNELRDMAQRWHVVQLLDDGRHYLDISHETGASTATITRIAQWLRHGEGGYREALDRRGPSSERAYPVRGES